MKLGHLVHVFDHRVLECLALGRPGLRQPHDPAGVSSIHALLLHVAGAHRVHDLVEFPEDLEQLLVISTTRTSQRWRRLTAVLLNFVTHGSGSYWGSGGPPLFGRRGCPRIFVISSHIYSFVDV